jgi:hypothetical protein
MANGKPKDGKLAALRRAGTLNPRPKDVADRLFQENEFFDARDLVQVKYEMLRQVRVDKSSVSQSAESFGFSRPSYYQAQAAFEEADMPEHSCTAGTEVGRSQMEVDDARTECRKSSGTRFSRMSIQATSPGKNSKRTFAG